MIKDYSNPFLDDPDDDETIDENTEANNTRKPWERDYTDEQRAEMAERKRNGELLPGHKKRTSTYRRSTVTDKDIELLSFIARFKYSTSKQLSVVADKQWKTVHNRLLGIEELNLVRRVHVPGARILWVVTGTGMTILEQAGEIEEDDSRLMKDSDITLSELGHTLAINQTAAWLTRGMKLGLLPDYVQTPFSNDVFVTEYKMRRSWEQFVDDNNLRGTKGATLVKDRGNAGEAHRREVLQKVRNGKIKPQTFMDDEPSLWTLSYANSRDRELRQFHYPDLVIDRETLRTNLEPVSIAFEIELTNKNAGELEKTLRIYKEDRFIYKHVVWVVNSEAMNQRIQRADEEFGMIESGKMSIIPVYDSDAKIHTGRPWEL